MKIALIIIGIFVFLSAYGYFWKMAGRHEYYEEETERMLGEILEQKLPEEW